MVKRGTTPDSRNSQLSLFDRAVDPDSLRANSSGSTARYKNLGGLRVTRARGDAAFYHVCHNCLFTVGTQKQIWPCGATQSGGVIPPPPPVGPASLRQHWSRSWSVSFGGFGGLDVPAPGARVLLCPACESPRTQAAPLPRHRHTCMPRAHAPHPKHKYIY
eukprot:591457-Prorocentrum_minimum.AAC.4